MNKPIDDGSRQESGLNLWTSATAWISECHSGTRTGNTHQEQTNNAQIVKADKWDSVMMALQNDNDHKIDNFIYSNQDHSLHLPRIS